MKLAFYIARRYLFAKKSRNVINYISFISGTIIAFVCMAMILVLSTFNGIDNLVKGLYSTLDPPVTISPQKGQYLSGIAVLEEGLTSTELSKVLQAQVVLQSGKQQMVATLFGVDERYLELCPLEANMNHGSSKKLLAFQEPNIVLGAGLHYHLQRGFQFPAFEPLVVMNIPQGAKISATNMGSFNRTAFNEIGTFSVTAEFDLKYAYTSRANFLRIFNLPDSAASFLALNPTQISDVAELKEAYGNAYAVESREEKNAVLFQTSQSEKWISFAILFFIVFVAAFNIVASLCILIMEKRNDLFVLKAIGMSEGQVSKVFFVQSLLINGLGMVVGVALGIGLVWLQEHVGLLRLQGSVVEFYPVQLKLSDLTLVVFTILMIAVVTFWPVKNLVRKLY